MNSHRLLVKVTASLAVIFILVVFYIVTVPPAGPVMRYYPNGNIKELIYYSNQKDSIGTRKVFGSNGILLDSIELKGLKIHGSAWHFDTISNSRSLVQYQNGETDGLAEAKYSNGQTKFKGYNKAGKQIGAWSFNQENGYPLTYEFFNSSGVQIFFRKYDNDSIIRSEGSAFIEYFYSKDTIKLREPFITKIILANPPNCKTSIIFQDEKDSINRAKGYHLFSIDCKLPLFSVRS